VHTEKLGFLNIVFFRAKHTRLMKTNGVERTIVCFDFCLATSGLQADEYFDYLEANDWVSEF